MKISDFSASRGGRSQLEQRWMESLAKGLQVREFTPTVSSTTGTFEIVTPPETGDHYIYCSVNSLTHVSFKVACELTVADSTHLYITLPKETIASCVFRGAVLSSAGTYPCYFSHLADSRTLQIGRETLADFPAAGLTFTLYGSFTYFSKIAA